MIKNAKFYQSTCLLEFGALFEAASLRSHRVGLQVQLQRTERRPVVNTASKCKTFWGVQTRAYLVLRRPNLLYQRNYYYMSSIDSNS